MKSQLVHTLNQKSENACYWVSYPELTIVISNHPERWIYLYFEHGATTDFR